jgi:hypothetical protein
MQKLQKILANGAPSTHSLERRFLQVEKAQVPVPLRSQPSGRADILSAYASSRLLARDLTRCRD